MSWTTPTMVRWTRSDCPATGDSFETMVFPKALPCGAMIRASDSLSRYIVNWDLRESMAEADIEIILERAKELHPEARPRIISDNGPQFIAKDFKEFIRVSGMTHVRT